MIPKKKQKLNDLKMGSVCRKNYSNVDFSGKERGNKVMAPQYPRQYP